MIEKDRKSQVVSKCSGLRAKVEVEVLKETSPKTEVNCDRFLDYSSIDSNSGLDSMGVAPKQKLHVLDV